MHQLAGLPPATRDRLDQTLAFEGPAAQQGEVGLESRFVEYDEPPGVDRLLAVTPIASMTLHVRTVLFGCASRLYVAAANASPCLPRGFLDASQTERLDPLDDRSVGGAPSDGGATAPLLARNGPLAAPLVDLRYQRATPFFCRTSFDTTSRLMEKRQPAQKNSHRQLRRRHQSAHADHATAASWQSLLGSGRAHSPFKAKEKRKVALVFAQLAVEASDQIGSLAA